MNIFRSAILFGVISILMLASSYYYYRTGQVAEQYQYNKFQAIQSTRGQREAYKDKLDTLKKQSNRIVSLSKEQKTNVDYEILLTDHGIKKLYNKVISTYDQGLFFLESAVIESSPSGISLTVKGFKVGANAQ